MSTQLGTRYDTVPIPPLAENTTWLDAGAVRLGVEFRELDDAILDAAFADKPDEFAIVDAARPEVLDDQGWSIHVNDAATDEEILRFDMFDDGPHYHYIVPGVYNLSIDFDTNACGDMFEWVLGCLEHRLPEMLRYAGASDLADRVVPSDVTARLADVRHVVGR